MSTIRDPDRTPLRLWLAVLGPPLLWYAEQQAVTALTKFACATAGAPLGPAAGVGGVILCLLCGALAWPRRRHPRHRFAAWMGLGFAGLFSLALAFQSLAAALLPSCAR